MLVAEEKELSDLIQKNPEAKEACEKFEMEISQKIENNVLGGKDQA